MCWLVPQNNCSRKAGAILRLPPMQCVRLAKHWAANRVGVAATAVKRAFPLEILEPNANLLRTAIASLLSALDVVIAVATPIVDLTGAIGKPVWVLTPAVPG